MGPPAKSRGGRLKSNLFDKGNMLCIELAIRVAKMVDVLAGDVFKFRLAASNFFCCKYAVHWFMCEAHGKDASCFTDTLKAFEKAVDMTLEDIVRDAGPKQNIGG